MKKIAGAHLSCSEKRLTDSKDLGHHTLGNHTDFTSQQFTGIIIFYVGFWLFVLMLVVILSKYNTCFNINKGIKNDNCLITLAHFDSWTLEK